MGDLFLAESLIWRNHSHRVLALLWISVLAVSAGLAVYLSVALLGFYLNPATISVLAVLFRLLDLAVAPAQLAGPGDAK